MKARMCEMLKVFGSSAGLEVGKLQGLPTLTGMEVAGIECNFFLTLCSELAFNFQQSQIMVVIYLLLKAFPSSLQLDILCWISLLN
jgi:hypothetical protein